MEKMILEQKLKEEIKKSNFEPRAYDIIPVIGAFVYFTRPLIRGMKKCDLSLDRIDMFYAMTFYHIAWTVTLKEIVKMASQFTNYF